MTIEEAIDYNKNLRMYMEISDKNQPCKFLKENHIALDMAIKSLEAWKKVKEEIKNQLELMNEVYSNNINYLIGMEEAQKIIDKHLSEVSE